MRVVGRYWIGLDGYVVPRTGIEPVRRLSLAADFKSAVSTNFTIGASARMEQAVMLSVVALAGILHGPCGIKADGACEEALISLA